jgi:hypothetical protein
MSSFNWRTPRSDIFVVGRSFFSQLYPIEFCRSSVDLHAPPNIEFLLVVFTRVSRLSGIVSLSRCGEKQLCAHCAQNYIKKFLYILMYKCDRPFRLFFQKKEKQNKISLFFDFREELADMSSSLFSHFTFLLSTSEELCERGKVELP